MGKYTLYRSGGECPLTLPGKTLVEAIEDNFDTIVESIGGVGNAAGYSLDSVWMEYSTSSNAVELHIIARGGDNLIGFDPRTEPKEYLAFVSASPEECQSRYFFELSETPPFDPFEDFPSASFGRILGTLAGLIDALAMSHCTAPYSASPCMDIIVKSPYILSSPDRFVAQALNCFQRLHPIKAKSSRILSRIDTLFKAVQSSQEQKVTDSFSIFYYKTLAFFARSEKVTAVAHYRRKAGITQTDLAKDLNISLRQMQRYENPRTSNLGNASYNFVCALADALHVRADQLIKGGHTVLVEK